MFKRAVKRTTLSRDGLLFRVKLVECVRIPLKSSQVPPHFSFSLPSALTPPELDNENNEFGVCFFLRASPSSTSLFISPGPYLSHRDPRVILFRPRHNTPTLSFFFCLHLMFCRFFHSLYSDITTSVFVLFHVRGPSFCLSLPPSVSLSPSLSVFLCDFMPQLLYYQSV